MSPIYDPPPRPRRRILYGLLWLAGSATLVAVLGYWLWGGGVARGIPGGPESASLQGAAAPPPAGAEDLDAVVDTRGEQAPVIGDGQEGGAASPSAQARDAVRATDPRAAGAASAAGRTTSARDPRAGSAPDGGSASPSGAADRAATGGPRGVVPSSSPPAGASLTPTPLAPSAPTTTTTAHPAAPPPANVANSGVRPEIWSPAASDGSGDAAHPPGSGASGVDVPADQADRGTDRVPPVIDSLAFDPPQIDDGNPARILIHAHDDLAGIRSVTGNVRSPSARAVFSFEATQADPNSGLYIATVNIPPKAETGSWYIAYLYIPDRADNALIVSYTPITAPPGATLSVASRDSDSTPPVVHGIILTNASVQGGERNHVRADVEDDASGVASIVGSFKSPSGAALIPFICRLSPETQAWEGDLLVPQSAECGQWTVNQVLATDKAGNAAVLQSPNPTLERVGFQVVGSTCDDTPPVLNSFAMAPSSVTNEGPSEVIVTASVSDTGSGATSLTGWATGPPATNGVTPKILFACVASTPSDPGSPWTGKIMVPQYAAKGTWRITRVRVQDRAQNIRDYTQADGILAGATFTVE